MTEDREGARRRAGTPLRQRSGKRWAAAGGVAACWVILEVMTGSAVSATVVLAVIAGLGAVSVGGLRAAGITRDHPWIRWMASRPWRDGQDVLKIAMRHLPDVFVVTPSGSLLAPDVVELQLNPDDLLWLRERMDAGVISASLTEVYEQQVAAYGARLAGSGRAEVYVIAAGSVPPGRYRLRQGDPVGAAARPDPPGFRYAGVPPQFAYAGPEHAYDDAGSGSRVWHAPGPAAGGMTALMEPARMGPATPDPTTMERSLPPVPVLRLVTGSSVAETLMSGARAGRGPVELALPDVPTVSREHATFTFCDGRWWITNQGRNGLTLNGISVSGEQPLSDGDTIRWGRRPDALASRVEIG